MKLRLSVLAAFLVAFGVSSTTLAQTTTRLSGTAFLDFVHHLDSPDDDLRGHSGFTYRRIYATADFGLSDAFSARVRLSADQGTADQRGPDVYIKDAFVNWRWSDQHNVTLGILPPPLFETSESVWGYRGLEEVLVDLSGLAASRDVGLRASGDINETGSLRYGVMVANNSDTRPETDRYKRIYGQIQGRSGPWIATLGANYAGYGDFRRDALMFSGVVGRISPEGRFGADWYVQQTEFITDDTQVNAGISIFGEVPVVERWSLVGRVDRFAVPVPGPSSQHFTLGLIGVAFQPIPEVQIVPNWYWLERTDADHNDMRLRLTVIANM